MVMKSMKGFCFTALVLGLVLASSGAFRFAMETVACVAALMVVTQAFRTGKYFWGIGFVALAALVNPVAPLTFSRQIFLGLEWVSIALFLASLVFLKWQPILSLHPVTRRTTGNESR